VANGTAEQLARLAHFQAMEETQPEELEAVALFILGRVRRDVVDRVLFWADLQPDCEQLWHLITDDWDDRDLDEVPEVDWARFDFATAEQELAHRHERTRGRLVDEIELAIAVARTATAENDRRPVAAGSAR
jgi:hypothetical protein